MCFEKRFDIDGSPRRTIKMLPIGPQLATLFENPNFIRVLDDENSSIRARFKGDIMQNLVNNKHLFNNRYDIGLSLYVDGFQSHKKGGAKLNLVMLQILNLPSAYRYKMEFLIDFAIIPNTKRLDSYLQYLVSELEKLARDGLQVQRNNSTNISLKVHLMGSFGDIPSVSELNFLASHTSLQGCRFCTIIGISKNGVISFQLAANDEDRPLRLLTIEEYKSSAPELGIERPSLFRNLPSFIDPTFVGLDEFHLFGQNMGPRIKKMFTDKESILRLKPRQIEKISICLNQLASTSPLIFEGNFMDVFSKGGTARGVDWLVFLKYFVPTVLIDHVDLCHLDPTVSEAAKEALRTISLICSVCLQQDISESEIQKLEELITKWHQFLRLHISAKFFPISEHYLEHITMVIRKIGPMPQYSCRVLERRIQMIKKRIHGCSQVAKQAENIMLDIACNSYEKRRTIAFDNSTDTAITFSKSLNMGDIKLSPSIASMLCKHYNTARVNPQIKCATSLRLGNNITIDSTFDPPSRKKKLSDHALVNCARRSSLPLLVKVLLIFEHNFSGATHALAVCQVYQNVTVSTSGIPECFLDNANSDTSNGAWDLDIIAVDDILSSVAVLKSAISGKLFFVWPDMKRIGLKVYNDDSIFDFA